MPFEITVQETHIDENVTGKTVDRDLTAAYTAAEARAAYDAVLAGEKPQAWAAKKQAGAAVEAALKLVKALGGADDHFKVSIHGDEDYLTVHVQKVAS